MLTAVTAVSMTGCGGKDSGSSDKDMKDLVYSSERLACMDQVKGDVSGFSVAGDDTIYLYTTEWIEPEGTDESGEIEARDGEAAVFEETDDAAAESEDGADDVAAESEDGADDVAATEGEDGAEAELINADTEDDSVEEEFSYQVNQYFYSFKPDGSEFKEIPFGIPYNQDEWLNMFQVSQDGNLYLLYSAYDQQTEKSTYYVRIVGSDGKLVKEISTDGLAESSEVYYQSLRCDSEGNIYLLTDQSVFILDPDGNKIGEAKSDQYINCIAVTNDGTVVASVSEEDGTKVYAIDKDKKQFGEAYELGSGYYNSLIAGKQYSFYYSDGASLFGYDMQSGKSKEILNWVSCNINSSYVGDIVALADGRFLAIYYDYSSEQGENGIYLFTKVDPSQVADKTVITYAGLYMDDSIRTQAVKFNKSQDKYQVVVKDYSSFEDPVTQMNNDLMAGNIPDLIDLSGISADKYIAKGMLTDLYELMDGDPDVKKEDFFENVLKVMETDGKLYHITPTFGVNGLIGRASDVGGRTSFTMQDLIELENAKPEGTTAFYMSSNSSILSQICCANYDNYIDWNTGKCSFDSQDFINLLEYANKYPGDEDINWSEDTESMPSMIRSGKVLFATIYSMSMEEVELYNKMFEDEICFIGYPSEQGIGGAVAMNMDIGIYAKSKNKEGAWEFLKTFLTREYISAPEYNYYSGFPLRKDAFEDAVKKNSATEEYVDDFGHTIQPLNSSWGYDDLEVEIKPLSDKEVQMIRDIIAGVDHLYVYNDDISSIISEEAGAYFSGQKTSKEVADIIQNRVSTYVNENR